MTFHVPAACVRLADDLLAMEGVRVRNPQAAFAVALRDAHNTGVAAGIEAALAVVVDDVCRAEISRLLREARRD